MSEDDTTNLSRRSVLGGIAGLAVAGGGLAAFSSTASADSGLNISSSNVSTTTDRGTITSVTVDPDFTVNWNGFDDAVGKVFYLVEAKVDNGDFQPLIRATPWLSADDIGTTGSYTLSSGDGPSIVVADENGKPNYDQWNFGNLSSSITLDSYLDGTSIGGAGDYAPSGDVNTDGFLQNNYPSNDFGYYGAASGTEPFASDTSGTDATTTVTLRYSFEFQRPNLSQLKSRIDYSNYDSLSGSDDFKELSVEKRKRIAVEDIDGLELSDIDEGNSRLVMFDETEEPYPTFETPSGLTYQQIRTNSDSHPGLLSQETSFDVTVTNQSDTSSGSGSSGSEVN